MKVFISWSGQCSKELAAVLRDWLPLVIQATKPYFSPDDIVKGTRWITEIASELESSSIGIICLTKENLNAPWIIFEAGALAKKLDTMKVCPILFGIKPTDVTGPLSQFQSARFEYSEIKKVLEMINSETNELSQDKFKLVFDKWWPDLDKKVNEIMSNREVPNTIEIRSDREILEEILMFMRSPGARFYKTGFLAEVARNLVDSIESITERVYELSTSDIFYNDLRSIRSSIIYILTIMGTHESDELKMRLDHALKRLELKNKA